MKDTKKKVNLYSVIDFRAAEQSLEQMAAGGWLLSKANSNVWEYKRIEPKKLHFAITLFPKASALDPEPSEEQQMMWEFCQRTGWKLAAQNAQMQIFYNEADDPIPLETDPVVQVRKVHSAAKKSFLPVWYILSALGMMQMGLIVMRLFEDPIGLFVSASNGYTASAWVLMFLLSISEVIHYFVWYAKAKRTAEELDMFLTPKDLRWLQSLILITAIFISLGWLLSMANNGLIRAGLVGLAYSSLLFLSIRLISKLLKQKKVSAKVNMTFTIIISMVCAYVFMGFLTYGIIHGDWGNFFTDDDSAGTYEYNGSAFHFYDHDLPLTVDDMRETNYTSYSTRKKTEHGLLLTQTFYEQRTRLDIPGQGRTPTLEYTVTEVRLPFLYSSCIQWLIDEHDQRSIEAIPDGFKNVYEMIDPAQWDANQAYQLCGQDTGPMSWYLICYDEYIVEITFFGWDPTEDQIEKAAEILSQL